MFNSRKLIIFFVLLVLLIAIPTLAPANGSERGSAKVTVAKAVLVGGDEIKSGQYDIQWESGSSEAKVMFFANGKSVAKLQGKTLKLENKSKHDTILTERDSSGRDVLKAIQFRGKQFKIVF